MIKVVIVDDDELCISVMVNQLDDLNVATYFSIR